MQDALNQSLGHLPAPEAMVSRHQRLATAFVADRTLSGAELEVLIERVQAFRPVIGRRLQRLQELDDDAESQWRGFLERNPEGRTSYTYGRYICHSTIKEVLR